MRSCRTKKAAPGRRWGLYLWPLSALLMTGCPDSSPPETPPVTNSPTIPFHFSAGKSPSPSPASTHVDELEFPQFVDAAEDAGIHHVYDNGASPKALMVESTGGGCGWIDYDLDGRIDLYLTQGGAPDTPQPQTRPPDSLFRQIADHQFTEIASKANIQDHEFGHGIAVGDYDNDGFDDIFVCNVGKNHLFHNQGDGTFVETTDIIQGERDVWSSSAAWGDIDRDGDLDLYVCNYGKYDPYHPLPCFDKNNIPSICHPRNVEANPDEFYLNVGDGKLVEMSREYKLFGPNNLALGVVIADMTGDDWPDIYVCNDTKANFLFVNHEGQKFQESAMLLGGAFAATGEPQASMGIAFNDFDQNGWPDLCLTHFTGEANALYQNLGPRGLQDVSGATGLRTPALPKLGFGIVMSDFNYDSHMDMFVTNGHIDPRYPDGEGYEMTAQSLSYDGRHWIDGSEKSGDFFFHKHVGRGVASADYDEDGDLDLAVVHVNEPAALLRNESKLGHGLRVSLTGVSSNRDGFGAKVVVGYNGQKQCLEMAGGTSYAAAPQRLFCFGLGDWAGPCEVAVHWPSGVVDTLRVDHPDVLIKILEGSHPPAEATSPLTCSVN